MIEQYTKAAADLRQLIREAHEALQDLKTESRNARVAMKQYETEAIAASTRRIAEAEKQIWEQLFDRFKSEFDEAFTKMRAMLRKTQDTTCGLIADSAQTLALAIRSQDADAALLVGDIARSTKRKMNQRDGEPT